MGYIKNNNGNLEIISCSKETALKEGYIIEPDGFKLSPYGKTDINYFNEDFTLKSDADLISDGLLIDNKGVYYYTENAQKIEITEYNIEKPEDVTELEPCDFPKWDGNKWIVDIELKKKTRLSELDSKSSQYIYENIGDETHQLKYLGRFSELQEKRIDGIELTTEEQAEKDALKELHRRYKEILVEYGIIKSKIENGEDVEIIFTK